VPFPSAGPRNAQIVRNEIRQLSRLIEVVIRVSVSRTLPGIAGPGGLCYAWPMQQGRGGMGSRKHGSSGRATKSPRLRLWARLDAERRSEPSRPKGKYLGSIRELLSREKSR
jgi:hypothetical protein